MRPKLITIVGGAVKGSTEKRNLKMKAVTLQELMLTCDIVLIRIRKDIATEI